MNTDFQAALDLNGEHMSAPCAAGGEAGLSFVADTVPLRHAGLPGVVESLEKAMIPAELTLEFRINTRMGGKNGGNVSGTDWTSQGEFAFSF